MSFICSGFYISIVFEFLTSLKSIWDSTVGRVRRLWPTYYIYSYTLTDSMSVKMYMEGKINYNYNYLNDRRVLLWFPAGATYFSLLQIVQTSSCAHPASCALWALCPGVKQSGYEVYHLPPSRAAVKNMCVLLPLHALLGMFRDNCTYTLYGI